MTHNLSGFKSGNVATRAWLILRENSWTSFLFSVEGIPFFCELSFHAATRGIAASMLLHPGSSSREALVLSYWAYYFELVLFTNGLEGKRTLPIASILLNPFYVLDVNMQLWTLSKTRRYNLDVPFECYGDHNILGRETIIEDNHMGMSSRSPDGAFGKSPDAKLVFAGINHKRE
ncbi:hypothetical protein VNO77_07673 [Canavalia gladiata]|uniref:Uncharacterized protein n=1 Tax=Canavalia gladiata TaxID=3824 RepID=A0AAN9M8M5_CANGL